MAGGVYGGPTTNLDIYGRVFGPGEASGTTVPNLVLNKTVELDELAQQVMRDVEGSEGPFRAWEGPAKEENQFYHGQQWDDADRMRMEQLKRPALVFNDIKPVINGVSGLERLNRVDISFKTRAMDSPLQLDLAGDLATEAVSAADDLCNAAEEDSDVAKECSIMGMAWAEVRCDYNTDVNGRVVYEKIPNTEMRWDSNCKRPNLEGSEWRARKRQVSRKSFIKQYGEDVLDKVDMGVPDMPYGQTEKYELVTPTYSLANERANPQVGGQSQTKKTIEIIQYQWKDMQPIYRFQDQDSEQITTLDEDKWDRLTKRMEMLGGSPPPAVKQSKPVYRNVVVSRGVVIEEPVDLPGGFSLLCMTGEWNEGKKRFCALVGDMMDPNRTKNKAISSALGFHVTNAKGGVIFKTSAFADPDHAKDQWSRYDAWIEANDDTKINEDIVYREPAKVSPDLGMFYQEGTKAINRVSGLNEEIMGIATGQTPSQTSRGRQQAGLVVLGWFWDNLDRHRREVARCKLDFIREYWTQGQLLDVGGQELGQQIPLLKQNLHESSWDYKLVLDESIRHNPNLKMSAWDSLLQSGLFQVMIKGGMIQMVMQLMKMLAPYPSQVINAMMRTLAQNPPQPPQKGRQAGPQKPGDPPQLIQAKIGHMDAQKQKALAQARQIDHQTKTQTPLQIAELLNDAHMQRQDLQHQKEQAMIDARMRAHEMHQKQMERQEKTRMQQLAKMVGFGMGGGQPQP